MISAAVAREFERVLGRENVFCNEADRLSYSSMVAIFKDMNEASETVAAIIANRIVPVTLEFMDNFTIRAVEDFSHVGLPVKS